MTILVSPELHSIINGSDFDAAPTVRQLHDLLGPPSRVVEPAQRAPVKHRNQQLHVYDTLGIHFHEHHYTRRITSCGIAFWPEEQGLRWTPLNAFSGELRIGEYQVPARPSLVGFVENCSAVGITHFLGGMFSARNGDYSMIIRAKGAKLGSGRRSKLLEIIDLSLSWPHDDWGEPARDE